jgi:hypothetical protein
VSPLGILVFSQKILKCNSVLIRLNNLRPTTLFALKEKLFGNRDVPELGFA